MEGRIERVPLVETVRGALFHKGKFLILEKDATSRIPGSFEFPGGKIDEQRDTLPTLEEQIRALKKEMIEETKVDISGISFKKVDEFSTVFEIEPSSPKNIRRTKVHLFLVPIPDSVNLSITVNETKNEKGEPEDKHASYAWVTPEELKNLSILNRDNAHTKKRTRPLARSSRRIRKLLEAMAA